MRGQSGKQQILPAMMNGIKSIQNITSVTPNMHLQIQLHLQEMRDHQQAQLQSSSLDTSHSPLALPQLHNGANGINGTSEANGTSGNGGQFPATNGHSSRNSSHATTNGHKRIKIEVKTVNNIAEKQLIDLVTCKLCKGYLIDATTLDLCMHTFCRPCAVTYIRKNQRCPECHIEIKDKRFLNRLKTDTTMQNIVYKIVPGLYEKEMARRRTFYASKPNTIARCPSEMFGDIPFAKTIKPDDMLNISLSWGEPSPEFDPIKMYLSCRADTTMSAIKKLIIAKFGLNRPIRIWFANTKGQNTEISFDLTALMDVAVTFNWRPDTFKDERLNLIFEEQDPPKEDATSKKPPQVSGANFSLLTSPDRAP